MNRPSMLFDNTGTHHGDPHLVMYLAAIEGRLADFCRMFNALSEQEKERYYADTFPTEKGEGDSYSPLHYYAENGMEQGVRLLVQDLHFNVNQYASRWVKTPLSCAASEGNYGICHFLLENGADPNRGGDLGERPLYQAVCSGNLALVRLLLQRGANPPSIISYDSRGNSYGTALNVLLQGRKSQETKLAITRLLVQYNGRASKFLQTTLDYIIRSNKYNSYSQDDAAYNNCAILLAAGVEPSDRAMPLAIKTNKQRIFRMLLQYGVDPFRQHGQQHVPNNDQDENDVAAVAPSPFLQAAASCTSDNTAIFESLLDHWDERFSSSNGKDSNGDHAIHVVLRYPEASLTAVQLVMKRQAKNLMKKPGFLPFDLVESNARLEVIYYVLRQCANELAPLLPRSTTTTPTDD
jgi:ankyrin repeat protein